MQKGKKRKAAMAAADNEEEEEEKDKEKEENEEREEEHEKTTKEESEQLEGQKKQPAADGVRKKPAKAVRKSEGQEIAGKSASSASGALLVGGVEQDIVASFAEVEQDSSKLSVAIGDPLDFFSQARQEVMGGSFWEGHGICAGSMQSWSSSTWRQQQQPAAIQLQRRQTSTFSSVLADDTVESAAAPAAATEAAAAAATAVAPAFAAAATAVAATAATTTQWVTGYDTQHHKAWRQDAKLPKSLLEFGEVFVAPNHTRWDPASARWPDGFQVDLPTLCVLDVQSLLANKPVAMVELPSSACSSEVHLTMERSGSTIRVVYKPQKGRGAGIVAMMIKQPKAKERQLCMCSVMSVGNDREAAVKVVSEVARMFQTGKVEEDGLLKLRNDILKAHGFPKGKRKKTRQVPQQLKWRKRRRAEK